LAIIAGKPASVAADRLSAKTSITVNSRINFILYTWLPLFARVRLKASIETDHIKLQPAPGNFLIPGSGNAIVVPACLAASRNGLRLRTAANITPVFAFWRVLARSG
jgi:hypothetical protein